MAGGAVGSMVALGMGQREPMHERRDVPVLSWTDDQVPVVRHDAVCKDAHVKEVRRILEHRFEERIVLLVPEEGHASIGTVNDVIYETFDVGSECSAHGGTLAHEVSDSKVPDTFNLQEMHQRCKL